MYTCKDNLIPLLYSGEKKQMKKEEVELRKEFMEKGLVAAWWEGEGVGGIGSLGLSDTT